MPSGDEVDQLRAAIEAALAAMTDDPMKNLREVSTGGTWTGEVADRIALQQALIGLQTGEAKWRLLEALRKLETLGVPAPETESPLEQAPEPAPEGQLA